MSRTIKFRVWNKHYKEYVKPSDGCSDYSFVQYKSGDFSLFGVSAECLIIQQYTGLKDKNGKEIYEGDILKDLEGYLYEVYWLDTSASFEIINKKDNILVEYDEPIFYYRDMNRVEVAGNTFENSDLLK